jgi:hypothetical protein
VIVLIAEPRMRASVASAVTRKPTEQEARDADEKEEAENSADDDGNISILGGESGGIEGRDGSGRRGGG